MLIRRLHLLREAFRDRRGVAAIEFAFVAPVLALLMLGAPDISSAIMASNRATFVAETIAQLISQTKVTLTDNDINQILQSAPLVDPDILTYARTANTSVENSVSIIATSVAFTLADANCKSNCKYDANVVFSRALSGSGRQCGKLVPGSDGSSGLPSEVYSANSIVAVDVTVRFKPLFSNLFFNELSFKRSAYFRPRYVEPVKSTNNCPAYAS
ncbi:MAG: pilus assembly protein [Methylobacterium mesophilicum]|nr:pilus assembly protein [Methylobacterium mesophilicum]